MNVTHYWPCHGPKLCFSCILQLICLLPPSLFPVCYGQIGHASKSLWVIQPQLCLSRSHHIYLQLLCFIPPSLFHVYQCQIAHYHKGVWMVGSKLCFSCMHHMHPKLLCLIPPSLLYVC